MGIPRDGRAARSRGTYGPATTVKRRGHTASIVTLLLGALMSTVQGAHHETKVRPTSSVPPCSGVHVDVHGVEPGGVMGQPDASTQMSAGAQSVTLWGAAGDCAGGAGHVQRGLRIHEHIREL
jgi:hypothetical protein